jgi:hypothetical protein
LSPFACGVLAVMAVARIGFENKYGRVKSSVLSPIKNKVIYVEKKTRYL